METTNMAVSSAGCQLSGSSLLKLFGAMGDFFPRSFFGRGVMFLSN
jgi:hypothetical protein